MIFYFSGTGNSLYVAKKIAEKTNDELIEITDDLIKNNTEFYVKEHEKIGFIFPVYWHGMPSVVEKFIEKLKIKTYSNQYVYSVVTYGFGAGNTLEFLSKMLYEKDIYLSGLYGVKMVDNYVIGYDVASIERQKVLLQKAEYIIDRIIGYIDINNKGQDYVRSSFGILSNAAHNIYKNIDHTKKFYADESCNTCRLCEKNCPCNVIKIENGKPAWKGECTFCLKCINTCPCKAIQYGKFTKRRGRYTNFNV